MPQTIPAFDFSEQHRMGSLLPTNPLLHQGAEAMLAAQAALFVNGEAVLMAWLNRRHEAITDTQRLLSRMRDCRDLSDAMQAQQEWMNGALKRLTDDAAECQRAMQMVMSAAVPDAAETRPRPGMDMPQQPANDGKPGPSLRGAGAKAAGER